MSKKVDTTSSAGSSEGTAWKAESLRFTAFLEQGESPDCSTWWADVVGDAPETKTQKFREGTLREEGPFLSGRLVLSIEPLRVDWMLTTDMQQVVAIGDFDSLPDFTSVHSEFTALSKRWVAIGIPVIRLAVGAVLLLPVRNREEGYTRLASYLPALKIDPVGSSDLLYQINRRRISRRSADFSINRLSKWSVALFHSAHLQIGLAPNPKSTLQTVGDSLAACRLELDVNTEPGIATPIPTEIVTLLIDELTELAIEIAKKGDQP